VDGLLEVHHQVRIGPQVRQPVALAGRAGDEQPAVDAQQPDLDAPRLPAAAPRGGDVDRQVVLERVPHQFVLVVGVVHAGNLRQGVGPDGRLRRCAIRMPVMRSRTSSAGWSRRWVARR
jgi:hypothetical protein